MTGRVQWLIRCPDYTVEVRGDRATAERRLAGIEEAGNCRQEHEIVEVEPAL